MSNKYIYIYQGNAKDKLSIFEDFNTLDNMQCIATKRKSIKSKLIKGIGNIYLSYKIAKKINLPFKSIWYDLSEIEINDEDNYTIIMLPNVFFDFDISIIKKLAKKKNVKLVLILLDTVGVNTPTGKMIDRIYKEPIWDYIFTYDLEDSKKYNFIYLNEHYYSKPKIEENKDVIYDAYFIGALKPGRTVELITLFEKLTSNNVNTRFDIVKNDIHYLQYQKENFNIYSKRLKYRDSLTNTTHANCIIEFLQKGQNAQSLRYFEAVVFNKKLLTTNKNVKKLSFYDGRYMKVFESFNDIDFEWVKKKENINYNYKDQFSPVHIIEELEKMQNKSDKNN